MDEYESSRLTKWECLRQLPFLHESRTQPRLTTDPCDIKAGNVRQIFRQHGRTPAATQPDTIANEKADVTNLLFLFADVGKRSVVH
jgi:hypothetical protein